jgi:hypothetical protein
METIANLWTKLAGRSRNKLDGRVDLIFGGFRGTILPNAANDKTRA